MRGEGATLRYAACALALELGLWDVDGMLEGMTYRQFNEWMTFFKVRSELRNAPERKGPKKHEAVKEDQQALARKIRTLFEAHNIRQVQ